MRKWLFALTIALVGVMFCPITNAQVSYTNTPPPPPSKTVVQHVDGWGRPVPGPMKGEEPGQAPKRDLSGIWEPTPFYRGGVFATGPQMYPSDGKHFVPFTPAGMKAWKANKPGFGTTAVPITENNDPFDICDPIGFPRIELFNLRAFQIFQNPRQMVIVYQNANVFREIWTDGRKLPKPSEVVNPRWYGYSVGKWLNDTTFEVETDGLDPRTWIDNVGRPHSSQLKVTEVFHRVNRNIMELTMTIDDPVMYTRPWKPLDKFRLGLQPAWFDLGEMVCAPSEEADFGKALNRTKGGDQPHHKMTPDQRRTP
jgi:hypothetical protein